MTSPQAPADPSGDERHHPLYLAEGEMRIYWRLPDNGLTLRGRRIAWTSDGRAREYDFAEIRSIRLQNTTGGSDGTLGVCQIRFRDGRVLNLYGGGDQGAFDADQAAHYTAFVRDLHARLPDDAVRRITFYAGLTDTRFALVTGAAIVGGLMFIALPLVLLVIVPWSEALKVLGLLGAGAALCWPMWKLWEANRPRRYSPRALPEELVA